MSKESQIIDMLCALKRAYEKHSPDPQRVNFTKVVKNADSRDKFIKQAAQSPIAEVSRLARQLERVDFSQVNLDSQAAAAFETQSASAGLSNPIPTPATPKQPPKIGLYVLGGGFAALIIGVTLFFFPMGSETIKGTLTGNVVLDGGTYKLQGIVYVSARSNLEIQPGTTIVGEPGSALVVSRDATIYAQGTPEEPIVFTSSQPEGQRKPGDWGGVVLLGNAPTNVANPTIEGVRDPRIITNFGGNDVFSNCGVLEYVRVEFAGYEAFANNELNGLTLGGCGKNTIIRHVQVHRSLDDGIEMFGGTADLKNILITGAGDDSLDWDMGWTGHVQFLIIQQHKDTGDNAFEGDNQQNNEDAKPRSAPSIYNATLISHIDSPEKHRAMVIRRGSGGQFHNMLITGFSNEAIDLRGDNVDRLISSGELNFSNILLYKIGSAGLYFSKEEGADDDDQGFFEVDYFSDPERDIIYDTSPGLPVLSFSETRPNFIPAADSIATEYARKPPQDEFWDEGANYLGAIRPGSAQSWTDGWTAFPPN